MAFVFFIAAMLCLLGVAGSLVAGIVMMTKEKSTASNRLMQARVLLQGLTVLFLFLAYLSK
jgi:hypothetical protein